MKKYYISPAMKVLQIDTQASMAVSDPFSGEMSGGEAGANESQTWDEGAAEPARRSVWDD
jgi:hypothetical protein